MICFNSGCSFTTPNNIIANNQMYWYLLASDLNCTQFINESRHGSSNELILQRVYNHVLENPKLDVFYIINITSLNRIELEISKSDKLQEILKPDALIRLDYEISELALFTQLIGIVSFLRLHNKNFYIINNSKELTSTPFPPRDNFVKYLREVPELLNVFSNSKYNFHKNVSKIKPYDYDQYGWSGHDDPTGHRAYYSMLKTLI